MYVIKNSEGKPKVKGAPENNEILFFGLTQEDMYCVIICPQKYSTTKCDIELYNAHIAFGHLNEEMKIKEVIHGHRYHNGGGMVEFGEGNPLDWDQVFFRKLDSNKKSTFNGEGFKKTYIVK